MEEADLFDLFELNEYKITKPVRLIELFGGYGSQHFALKYLGVDFEHYKLCEWAVKSIQAYKDGHYKSDNTNYSAILTKDEVVDYLFKKKISMDYNKPMTRKEIVRLGEKRQRAIYNNIQAEKNLVDIQQTKGSDLEIVDTDKYDYLMTYSFPCQDLSLAGLGKGMEKGSGTRSSMLWEVKRVLDECEELPQILLMENVPQVHGKENRDSFDKWCNFLKSKGYTNYWKDLNAKDFEIPQNRRRTFMVSILGNYVYEFPKEKELKLRLKDLLESEVDEKYYIDSERVDCLINKIKDGKKGSYPSGDKTEITQALSSREHRASGWKPIAPTLCARDYKDPNVVAVREATKKGYAIAKEGDSINISQPNSTTRRGRVGKQMANTLLTGSEQCVVESKVEVIGGFGEKNLGKQYRQGNRVYNSEKISPTLMAQPLGNAAGNSPLIVEPIRLGGLFDNEKGKHQAGSVWDKNGLAPTLDTMQGGYRQPSIVESKKEFGRMGKQAAETFNENESDFGDTINPFNKVLLKDGVSPTITTRPDGFKTAIIPVTENLRIRKLTPKECFRLMAVKDKDYENIAENQSNSSLYHLAGDSIVITVLMAIISKFY